MQPPATKNQTRRMTTTFMPDTKLLTLTRILVEAVTHTAPMITVTNSLPPRTTAVGQGTHLGALTTTCRTSSTNTLIPTTVLAEADPRLDMDLLIWSSVATPRSESCHLPTTTALMGTTSHPLLTTTHPSTTVSMTMFRLTLSNPKNNTNSIAMVNSPQVIGSPRKRAMTLDTRRLLRI